MEQMQKKLKMSKKIKRKNAINKNKDKLKRNGWKKQ
jgi:hypothetical protein